MNNRILAVSILSMVIVFSSSTAVFGHPHQGQVLINSHTHQPQTQYIPLNGLIGIEKTSVIFHAPEENSLPWAFVEGKIANPVAGYPVVIQIFKEDEAVHFAQTDVSDDGNYQYKFRVLNIEGGEPNKIFEGDYEVIIFKVVYLNQEGTV